MEIKRRKTRVIRVGKIEIGGKNPIIVQSMLKSKIKDHGAIISEIKGLEGCGCEMIRIAIPDKEAADCFDKLIKEGAFKVPVIADIHFDSRLALQSLDAGADCVRINPGNIGSDERVAKIILKAKMLNSAIRIGVNSGSIDKGTLKKNGGNIKQAMVESVLENVRLLEKNKFYNFKVSAKSSSVTDTIDIYREISRRIDYPVHLGVTEAGPVFNGSIKSSVGMGILLSGGIGDTLRVSLTGSSVDEVKAAYIILSSLGLRDYGVNIISCPTCGRTKVDLEKIVRDIEGITRDIKKNIKVAVMGCIVNGPGEAKDADIGIAYGRKKAAIFIKGKIIRRIETGRVFEEFKKDLNKFIIQS